MSSRFEHLVKRRAWLDHRAFGEQTDRDVVDAMNDRHAIGGANPLEDLDWLVGVER